MTNVGDDQLMALVVSTMLLDQGLTQVVQALTGRCAEREGRDVGIAVRGKGKVALVPYHDDVGVVGELKGVDSGLDVFLRIRACVEKEQDRGGAGGFGEGTANAFGLDDVICISKSGCVDEPKPKAVDGAGVFHRVAGCSGDVGDDGPVVAEEGVEQGGLAAVGGADDGDGDAFFHGVAGRETVREAADTGEEVDEQGVEAFAVRELDVFLGKIELEFEEAGEADECFAQGVDFAGEAASKLVEGEAVCARVFCGNEVGDGFGLGEVESAIEEGALRELAGTGLAAPCFDEGPHDLALDELRAVDVELHRVFTGVGAGATKDEGEAFVKDGASSIAESAEGDRAIGDGVEGLGEDLGAEGEGFGAGDAHHGDSTRTGGGGDGANRGAVNCVAKGGVHGANLA